MLQMYTDLFLQDTIELDIFLMRSGGTVPLLMNNRKESGQTRSYAQ